MIFWSRWGIVVLAFFGFGIAMGFGLGSALGLIEESGPVNAVFVGLGWMVSAGLLWLLVRLVVGTYIDKPQPVVIQQERTVDGVNTWHTFPAIDPATGQQVMTNPRSTFFFVPLRRWPFVLGALGLGVASINVILVQTR